MPHSSRVLCERVGILTSSVFLCVLCGCRDFDVPPCPPCPLWLESRRNRRNRHLIPRSLLQKLRIRTSLNLHHPHQIPSLPIPPPLRPLTPRRKMQRQPLPHRLIRDDVPLPHRNHPHRKEVDGPLLV